MLFFSDFDLHLQDSVWSRGHFVRFGCFFAAIPVTYFQQSHDFLRRLAFNLCYPCYDDTLSRILPEIEVFVFNRKQILDIFIVDLKIRDPKDVFIRDDLRYEHVQVIHRLMHYPRVLTRADHSTHNNSINKNIFYIKNLTYATTGPTIYLILPLLLFYVNVLPAPVAPYAKTVALNPSTTPSSRKCDVFSKISFCVTF